MSNASFIAKSARSQIDHVVGEVKGDLYFTLKRLPLGTDCASQRQPRYRLMPTNTPFYQPHLQTEDLHDKYTMSNPHYKYSLDTALTVHTTLSGRVPRMRSRKERGRSHLTGSGVIL